MYPIFILTKKSTRINFILISTFSTFRWQSRKEGDRNMRAGLIPSRALQEKRIIAERTKAAQIGEEGR